MKNTVAGEPSMKTPLVLILCVLICGNLPSGAAGAVTAGVSFAGGPPDTPTENVLFYINDAKAAVNGQNWTSALLLTTRGLAYYPDDPELLCLQAYTYRKLGQSTKSVEAVSKAILLDPKPARYANRGYGYLALGNYSAALADAQAGISKDTTYSTNYGVEALSLQGLGRNPEAVAAIQQAIALEPENAHYWHVDGRLLAAAGNCTGARGALEKSVAINPDYSLPYPGFMSASTTLSSLNTTCIPAAAPLPSPPLPMKSPSGGIAVIGVIGALFAAGIRKVSP
jgi:tetratricopeptide (TPR) repeat protein